MMKAEQRSAQRAESISFEDITAEMGDIRLPLTDGGDAPGTTSPEADYFDPTATVIIDDAEVPQKKQEENPHLRVLTGSSPKPRPMWMDGLLSNLLAAGFMAPIVLRTNFIYYQPWISFMAMFLALGGGVWSLLGLRREDTVLGRRLCWVGAGVGLLVIALAFIFRAPPTAH